MDDEAGIGELELGTQLGGEGWRIVSDGWQSAASLWACGTEGRYEDMSTGAHALAQRIDVTLSLLASHEEMKHGPVMPQRISSGGPKVGHILMQERDRGSGRSQAIAQLIESGGRDIQDRQIAVTRGEQLIDEE